MVSYIATLVLGLAAFAAAQDSVSTTSVSIPPNPATTLLTQTNSNGVITGQPAIVTSQPAVVTSQPAQPSLITSQPPIASLPALGSGTFTFTFNNATYAISGNQTSLIATSTTRSTSTSGSNSGSGSNNSSANGSSTTAQGAAASGQIAIGALLGAAGLVAAFL